MLVLDALFDHIQQISSNVEISKSVLLRTLVAASGAKTAAFGVSSFVPKWRARRDSNS
jgi:site-specific DNA recombinase